jgi:hypothetical protein
MLHPIEKMPAEAFFRRFKPPKPNVAPEESPVIEQIKKRDSRVVEFDPSKITAAIAKAGHASGEFGEREARKMTLRVLTLAHELRLGPTPEVEEVQDIVERVLLDSPYYKTAKAYIIYREQHAQIRRIATEAQVDLVEHYIRKLDWKIKENSNMCYSLQGLNNYISSDVTSEYWLNKIYPPEIRRAHAEGISTFTTSACYRSTVSDGISPTCYATVSRGSKARWKAHRPDTCVPPWARSSTSSTRSRGKRPAPRPCPTSTRCWHPSSDTISSSYKKVKQALQEFVFNINIPTRVGFQTPFTNITMDLYVPGTLKINRWSSVERTKKPPTVNFRRKWTHSTGHLPK